MEEGAAKYLLIQLVDTGELFHNLDQVIHCGFPLHSAAIINLKQKEASEATCGNNSEGVYRFLVSYWGNALYATKNNEDSPSLMVFAPTLVSTALWPLKNEKGCPKNF